MYKLAIDESVTQGQIIQMADDMKLNFIQRFLQTENNPLEFVWATPDRNTVVSYIEDDFIGMNYLAIQGPDAEQIAAAFKKNIGALYDLPEVIKRAMSEKDIIELKETAAMLAVLAPDNYDPETFNAFVHLLSSQSPSVRQTAILATAYKGWKEFIPLLLNIKEHDPEDFVRWHAEEVLAAYGKS